MATSALRAAATTAGRLSRSTTVVMGAENGHHVFRVKGYSRAKEIPNGQYMTLGAIDVGGHSWSLHYYPNGKTAFDAGYVSLFLSRDGGGGGISGMPATYRFGVLGRDGKPAPSFTNSVFRTEGFSTQGAYGYEKFMRREEFEKSECLKDDSFAIQCDVSVAAVEPAGNEGLAGVAPSPLPPAVVALPESDLQKDLAELLWSKLGTDVTIEVRGETFHAHKCMLAARSPEFREKFFGGSTQRKTAVAHNIQIDDMGPEVFKSMLRFMYTGTLPKMDEEAMSAMAAGLLAAADRFKLDNLKKICEEMMCERVDMGTIEISLVFSERHHCPKLKAKCLEFLNSPGNLKAIMAKDGSFDLAKKNSPTLLLEFFMKLWLEKGSGEPKLLN
ncbi:unnamed protein product [Urochloa decumbens]|uniref:BTB domain-containing protein n=1 Tax=Urochloa decumbens TaxID=240449 RepID=A0ABC9E617_9POAL